MSATAERLSLPRSEWPLPDQAALDLALAPDDDLLGDGGSAAELRPDTLVALIQAYGQWLAFLLRIGELDPNEQPGDRPTMAHLSAFRRDNKARGLEPTTRRQMLIFLRAMLRHLVPGRDWGFVTRPNGVPLKRAIPGRPREFRIRNVSEVLKLVHKLHCEALMMADSPDRRRDLRDAAFIGLLLTRAPRVGSIVHMDMTWHIIPGEGGSWSVRFPPQHTKNHRSLSYPLDGEVSAMLNDYLVEARPSFPSAGQSDHLWMGMKGPLTKQGLQRIMRRRTSEWFGEAHGPHICRKWLRAAAARVSPELAIDTAVVMGHTVQTALDAYTEASGLHAALRYGDQTEERRAQIGSRRERLVRDRVDRWLER